MKNFYGFAHFGGLVNNTPDEVATIGEISSLSITFNKDKQLYSLTNYPGLTVIGFKSCDDGNEIQISEQDQLDILKVCDWTYKETIAGRIKEPLDSYRQSFIQKFGKEFALIDSGRHLEFNNKYGPEYVTFAPIGKSQKEQWKIWFADESFFNQYDIYEIAVVPPIRNIDDFFNSYQKVYDLVQPVNTVDIENRANKEIGKYPPTTRRVDMFDWVDRTDKKRTIPTSWTTIHWGDAGNNIDAVKEAIRDYILKNSKYPRDDWAEIFPEIFTSTEFIILPAYHKIAVPDKTRETGVDSPLLRDAELKKLAKAVVRGTGYTTAYIDKVMTYATTLHRSLGIGIVGGPENRDSIYYFDQRYPDYANIPTTHVDFGKMSEETREFVMLLSSMLMAAEELTKNTSVPRGHTMTNGEMIRFNRIVRDDVMYLGATYKKFLYLVPTKDTVLGAMK